MNDRSPEHIRPLLARIDRLMAERERVLVAIDGGGQAAKRRWERCCKAFTPAPFSTWTIFSPPRAAHAGAVFRAGRQCRPRALFVGSPAAAARGKTVDYRRFDCKTFTIASPRRIETGRLNIIEGAYAMHPDLAPYYDLTVFLAVSAEKQRERILVRNTPAQAELFFDRWIPFEQRYFAALNVPERCDLTIFLDDQTSVP